MLLEGQSIEPLGAPRLERIEHVMCHRGLQALVAQGALGLAPMPLGELRPDKAPDVVRRELRQATRQGIRAHRPPSRAQYK
jgi:hypothetical protein